MCGAPVSSEALYWYNHLNRNKDPAQKQTSAMIEHRVHSKNMNPFEHEQRPDF